MDNNMDYLFILILIKYSFQFYVREKLSKFKAQKFTNLMKKTFLTTIILSLTISCNKNSTENTVTVENSDSLTIIPESNDPIESSTLQTCYLEVVSKDSVFLTLEDNLGTITGKMKYKNFEKDSSFGDIIGSQNGDTLKLVYNFEAEGTQSEREIYFLKKDGNLLEGLGDQTTDGNKSTYKNPVQIKFEGHALKQVDCTDFETKMKSK